MLKVFRSRYRMRATLLFYAARSSIRETRARKTWWSIAVVTRSSCHVPMSLYWHCRKRWHRCGPWKSKTWSWRVKLCRLSASSCAWKSKWPDSMRNNWIRCFRCKVTMRIFRVKCCSCEQRTSIFARKALLPSLPSTLWAASALQVVQSSVRHSEWNRRVKRSDRWHRSRKFSSIRARQSQCRLDPQVTPPSLSLTMNHLLH